jgi:hypothetical protein
LLELPERMGRRPLEVPALPSTGESKQSECELFPVNRPAIRWDLREPISIIVQIQC